MPARAGKASSEPSVLRIAATVAAGVVLALVAATPARAVDGVIEINHARALRGGVTSTDNVGYPVIISEAGSYRLTGNLTLPDENTGGILITTNNVTLDLNGFAIVGTTVCSGTPPSCSPSGTGIGVRVISAVRAVTVKNGTIRGTGAAGVQVESSAAGSFARIESVRVVSAGADGIRTNSSALVSDCSVTSVNDFGIVTGGDSGAIVVDNTATDTGSGGIAVSDSRLIARNVVRRADTTALGGSSASAGVIADNVTSDSSVGISAASTLAATLATGNVSGGNYTGITTSEDALVIENVMTSSVSYGFVTANALPGYVGNVFNDNGTDVSGGTELGENMCGGDKTCP